MEIGEVPDPDHRAALWALNHFQFGRVREGLKQLDPAMDWPVIDAAFQKAVGAGLMSPLDRLEARSLADAGEVFVPRYEDNIEGFKASMKRIADEMEKLGI